MQLLDRRREHCHRGEKVTGFREPLGQTALTLDHVASDIHRPPHGSESSRQVHPCRKNGWVSPLAPVTGDGDQRLAERMRDRDLRWRWWLSGVEARPTFGNLEPPRSGPGQGLERAIRLSLAMHDHA